VYLKRSRRRYKGEDYESWSLVESVRTARGPRQRVVATLGKLRAGRRSPRGLGACGRHLGWQGPARRFFQRPAEPPSGPRWTCKGSRWSACAPSAMFTSAWPCGGGWDWIGFLPRRSSRAAKKSAGPRWLHSDPGPFLRAFFELQIADFWYGKTALDELWRRRGQVNETALPCAGSAFASQGRLFRHFQRAYGELFGTTYDLLLYDITSTYFEGQCAGNGQARRGYSRDNRPDCLQVCIGLVVTPEACRWPTKFSTATAPT